MTENQLIRASLPIAENHLKILRESADLCNKTKKPDVFFSRYELLIEHGEQLVKLSKYIKFKGATPKETLNQVLKKRPAAIKQLIDRCFEDAEKLKTETARKKRYDKILKDFIPYKSEIDKANWCYLEEMCANKIETK